MGKPRPRHRRRGPDSRQGDAAAGRICGTCGNEVPEGAWQCPYCDAPKYGSPGGERRPQARVVTINLKAGLPPVDDALARFDRELAAAAAAGVKVLRVVHGYGSSGVGGKIRQAVRGRLRSRGEDLGVRRFIPGEEYSQHTNLGRQLLADFPALRRSLLSDRENSGITFVVL